VLCNVGTIKEGVDLPCIDLIAFCDKKQSRIDIIQCLGRGLRLYGEKRDCLVTCCVPVKDSEIGVEEFKTIKDVLRALKSIDARVEDVLLGKPSSLAMYYDGESGIGLNREGFYETVRLGMFGNWYDTLEELDRFLSANGKRPVQ
jgi:superfamily II DNA or RNA helicase